MARIAGRQKDLIKRLGARRVPLEDICAKTNLAHDVALSALREARAPVRFTANSASIDASDLADVLRFLNGVKRARRNLPESNKFRSPIDQRATDGGFIHDLLQGWIYFVECEDFIKIGYSDTPLRRLDKMRTANPFPIKLLAVTKGNRQTEKSLHRQWRAQFHQGEWFKASPELRSFVASLRASPSQELAA